MRLPYAPTTPSDASPSTAAIYARIAARRAPRPLIPLDLALLHSPAVADGWNGFLGAIRTQTSVPAGVLELAISRVGALNGAVHEWTVHAALALKAGVSAAGMESVRTAEAALPLVERADGEGGLSARQWAVLAYTDQMTRAVVVDERCFRRLRDFFTDREVVELTATVAAYNCVSRFLVALDVGENNGHEMKSVEELSKAAAAAAKS
ncbi:putative 4-carboxymuconolactone decarboxylase [Cryomyces antarcticus]